ncbi:MAG: hypothetical protein BWY12_01605 [candidate division BRC1 bacterium ADurb.Bin183]|nr:MAG: hypothetical protein BWY12_01605 [candidate division BRC1 bacterium ADurb.Bin183]
MSFIRSRRGKYALIFKACNDVGKCAVAVFFFDEWAKSLRAICQNHRADFKGDVFRLGVQINCANAARLFAGAAHNAAFVFGRIADFVHNKCIGDRLRVIFVDCFSEGKPLLIFVGNADGAFFGAIAAGGAFCLIHKTRMFSDSEREIARLSFDCHEFGACEDFNIFVASALNQFWGKDAQRAVVGGKSFIEHRHISADGGFLFDKKDLVSHSGEVERGLNACDASANHCHCAGYF